MENSTFVTDPEITNYINASIGELYDVIIQHYGEDYYVSTDTINVTANTSSYALPSDFYKLLGADLVLDSNRSVTLKRFNFNERNKSTVLQDRTPYRYRYHLVGDNIEFRPTPNSGDTVKLWYIPLPVELSDDADEVKGFSGWEEYIIIDAAIKCLQKEESDVGVLFGQKQAMLQRIETAAENRTVAEPSRISDTQNDMYDLEESYTWRY